MVSTQIITPATWAETRRNSVLSPFGTAAMPGYAGYPATVPAQEVMTGSFSLGGLPAIPAPGHPATALRLSIPAGAPTGGGVALSEPLPAGDYILTMLVNRQTGPTTTLQPAVRGIRGFGAARTFTFNVWTYVEEAFTIAPSEAPAIIGTRTTVTDAAASSFLIGNMQIASVGQNAAQGVLVVSGVTGEVTPTLRRRFIGVAEASPSVEEVYVPEVYGPVYEEVTLTSPDDEITFRALPEGGGFVYDNETLQRWYEPAASEPDVDSRPNANGSYGLGQVFTAEHRPIIVGQYYGTDSIDAKAQRQRLIAMRNEGNPILMTVKDESGVTTRREVWLVDYAAPFAADFSHFTFDLDLIAPDALRYGERMTDSSGMPTPGSGLVWNLGTAPSGLYFDWGTPGNLGQITLTNEGGAATGPIIEVGGPGTIVGGFRVTEIETGRELTFARALAYGDVIVLDSQAQNATLNGADVTGLMTSRKWFTVPRGVTRRYQITPLGSVSGAPTITGYIDAAWL